MKHCSQRRCCINKGNHNNYRSRKKVSRKYPTIMGKLPIWALSLLYCHLEIYTLFLGSHRCWGGMACGVGVTAMSHGIFLLS